MSASSRPTLAIIGGSGALGSALALRWAAAGYTVTIGSRSREKAIECARSLRAARGMSSDTLAIAGDDYIGAARSADIVVITVPHSSHDATLMEIGSVVAGKIVVDTVVPLLPPKVSVVHVPAHQSAGQAAQFLLGPDVRVVSAFHNVSAAKLRAEGDVDCDVLVFGNDADSRAAVCALVASTGAQPVEGGPIANSIAAEALTAVLIGINRRYKSPGAGIRITGLDAPRIPAVGRDGGGDGGN